MGEFVPMVAESGDRARQRAEERERRASERSAQALERTTRRAAEREQASKERQDMREARRLEEAERLKAFRPERSADGEAATVAPKRRSSGTIRRTGEARIERDVRNYSTVVDKGRIRELSARGTSVASLATVFGITTEEVEAALNDLDSGRDGES